MEAFDPVPNYIGGFSEQTIYTIAHDIVRFKEYKDGETIVK